MDLSILDKNDRIGIYGTGKNAERVLEHLHSYNIVGMISESTEERCFLGKKIYKIEDILAQIDVIIIAAIPQSALIVYKRIKDKVPVRVKLYDMAGRRLNKVKLYESNPYWRTSYNDLIKAIDEHETILIDVFGTLLAEKFYQKEDIFRIVEKELVKEDLSIPFCQWRISCEKLISGKNTYYNIDKIYQLMQEEKSLTAGLISACREKEKKLLAKYFVPRKEIVNALKYVQKKQKRLIFISKACYSKKYVVALLKKFNLDFYDELYILHEVKPKLKRADRYRYLSQREKNAPLFINSDENMPAGYDAFFVMSVKQMLFSSSFAFLADDAKNLADRFLLCHIIARIYNNPFVLNETKGRYVFSDAKIFGYACVSPIALCHVSWIMEQALAHKNAVVLFASRDGYFLKKIYEHYGKIIKLPPAIYFYTSRMAATIASIKDIDDIKNVCKKAGNHLKLKLSAYISYRFGIKCADLSDDTVGDILKKYGPDKIEEIVLGYKDKILSHAAEQRKNYLSYIKDLQLDCFDEIFFVDLLTQGTTYDALMKYANIRLKLLAMVLHREIKKKKETQSLLDELSGVDMKSYLCLVLELCFSSGEGQLEKIDENGKAKFVPDSEYDKGVLFDIQEGVRQMIHEFNYYEVDFLKESISKIFSLSVLSIIFWQNSYFKRKLVEKFSTFDFDGRYNLLEQAGCEIID